MLETLATSQNIENKRDLLKKATRPQIFLMVKLQHLATNQRVTIGNVHCIWGPHKLDVNTLYVAMSMEKLLEFADGEPHIIAGDFNSPPDKQPYKLLKNQKLSATELAGLEALRSVKFKHQQSFAGLFSDCFTHNSYNLRSSYFDVMSREPVYTCIESRDANKCNCDYIWYSSHLNAVDALDVTEVEPVHGDIRIPNGIHPTDHISIKATLSFNPNIKL